ncbi:hypothetical protein BDV26DRAFT_276020 [Aspergillus bertholletiae]|uniref:Uncharacterized protein n=1 Tax=Aspergillus bertholletiae TaxID=1226010 RepID=A0A5N7AQ96_9EURO|nr:hypothetical protein BDV26DRAFT_276020 [Aspergillus bertholletiae]
MGTGYEVRLVRCFHGLNLSVTTYGVLGSFFFNFFRRRQGKVVPILGICFLWSISFLSFFSLEGFVLVGEQRLVPSSSGLILIDNLILVLTLLVLR